MAEPFSADDFERIYFVVHSPDASLTTALASGQYPPTVELVDPDRLAALAVDAGLTDWLRDKVF